MMRCIDHPSMLRDGVGWGAPSGVTAAYLASMGFTGAPALTCEGVDAESHWEDLGQAWRIVEHTHYKAYPCCRWAHPAIDSVLHMMDLHCLEANDIHRVVIKTFHYATRLAGARPANLDEFSYSICFPVALAIVRRKIGLEELDVALLNDPDVLRISDKIELLDDDEMTRISIDKRWAQVSLHTTDGRALVDEPRSARGDPDDAISNTELLTKYHALADDVLGVDRATELQQMAVQFDQLSTADFSRLLDLSLAATDK